MPKLCVLGLFVPNRMENAPLVQKVLTEYGCNIKTRIGLHEATENVCAPSGLILLELFGDDTVCAELKEKLEGVKGVQVRDMVFDT